MGGRKAGSWHLWVIPILCTALCLIPHAACFRVLRIHDPLQLLPYDGQYAGKVLLQARVLAEDPEVEAVESAAEDATAGGRNKMVLGGGINRLGIHGEGLGFAHALLESDAEVMALAAAMESGDAFAVGGGLDRREDADDDAATGGEPAAAEDAPRKPGRLEKVAEKLAVVARSRDGAADGAGQTPAEATPSPPGAQQDEAVQTVKAPAAAAAADALPPWFSRKTAGAVLEGTKKPSDHGHSAGRHTNRRTRQHSSGEDTWLMCHKQYVKEAAEGGKHGGWDVLFYGDSIVEEWRGTFLGAPWGPFHDVRKVWDEFFGRKPYKAHSLGIASDGVEQLSWRLQHGEVPDKAHQPKVIVLHVGTNDIVGECTDALGSKVAAGIESTVTHLHAKMPSTHIIVMAILPKGEVWPNRCSSAIDTANSALQSLAEARSDHVHYLDVGQAFLSESTDSNKFEIKEALMPDSMHPSAVGMRIIAGQLEPLVSRLVATPLQTGLESQR